MGNSKNNFLLLVLFVSLVGIQDVGAQETQSTESELGFEDAESTLNQGLFETYYSSGKVKFGLNPDQVGLENEYILHAAVISGTDGSANEEIKAGWRSTKSKIVSFLLQDGKFRIVEKTLSFQSDASLKSDDAVKSNTPLGVLAESKVERYTQSTNTFLNLEELFKNDKLLGDFLKTHSLIHSSAYVRRVLTYQDNIDIRVRHTFRKAGPTVLAGSSHRNIDLEIQYSFIRMPKEGFSPRKPDPRIGYFRTVPSRYLEVGKVDRLEQFIHRWRLEKRDKEAEVSPPVSPIVFYIGKSTPENLKPMMRAGVLKWNSAFENIGFRNAIVVKDQPANSDWDENDINYNVVRWVSSPDAGSNFSTFITNPRTGEILGANVVIDDHFFDLYQGRATSVVHGNGTGGALDQGQNGNVLRSDLSNRRKSSNFDNSQDPNYVSMFGMQYCEIGNSISQNALFEMTRDEGDIVSESDYRSLWADFTTHVVAHEVGHALGLTHNFAGSQHIPFGMIGDVEKAGQIRSSSSIMDYVDPYFIEQKEKVVVVGVSPDIGPYDHWAIEFGYRGGFRGGSAHSEWRKALLNEASKPEYLFGLDGSRSVLAVPNDFTDNPISFREFQLEVLSAALERLDTGPAYEVESAGEFSDHLMTLNRVRKNHLYRLTEYVGGYETRVVDNDENTQVWQTVPVASADQLRALRVIAKFAFDQNNRFSFKERRNHLVHIDSLGRVYATFPVSDFDVSWGLLPNLLSSTRMTRLTWGEELGSDLSVEVYLAEMTKIVFQETPSDIQASGNQSIQIQYVKSMLKMSGLAPNVGPKFPSSVETAALSEMSNIRKEIGRLPSKTIGQRTHKNQLTRLAGRAEPTWSGFGIDVVRRVLVWVVT